MEQSWASLRGSKSNSHPPRQRFAAFDTRHVIRMSEETGEGWGGEALPLDVVDHLSRDKFWLERVCLQHVAAHRALHLEPPAVPQLQHHRGGEAEQPVDRGRLEKHYKPEASVAVLFAGRSRGVLRK